MEVARPFARQATDEDLSKIVDDYAGKDTNPLNPFMSVERLKQIPRNGLWIAEVGGEYAGFICWFVATDTHSDGSIDKYARIQEVRVRKGFFNKKVGETLLRHALKEIEMQNVSSIYVHVPEGNVNLQNLYEKIGFSVFARTVHLRFDFPRDRSKRTRTRDEARELVVFLVELREQCRVFLTAYSELTELLTKVPPPDADGQREYNAKVWMRLQAALVACSVVSKILWPYHARKKGELDRLVIERGRALRHFLKLLGSSPFPLAVRNAFEHIDDRLTEWLPRQSADIPWGWSLSPFEASEEPKPSSGAFRYFNMVTFDLRVADARCNLREVREQILNIDSRLPHEAQVTFGEWRKESPRESGSN